MRSPLVLLSRLLLPAILLAGSPLVGGEEKDKDAEFQGRVDQAIRRGCEFIAGVAGAGGVASTDPESELRVLTLLHGGWPRDHAALKPNLERLLHSPLQSTYNVAVTALALVHLDRIRYQTRIADCAQWLVDNQSMNGQWSYGDFRLATTRGGEPPKISTGSEPTPFAPITLRRRRPASQVAGDNSNTQFALLGLYAARLANVQAPTETWHRSRDHFLGTQGASGGWGYSGDDDGSSYGSMTCAGVAALEICARATKRESRIDKSIERGLAWLARRFSVKKHPGRETAGGGPQDTWYFYYLYSLERAGVLCDVRRFSGRDWYREGAEVLLSLQTEGGSWGGGAPDTCFAVLFLKRATRSLSLDGGGRAAVTTPDDELGEGEHPKTTED